MTRQTRQSDHSAQKSIPLEQAVQVVYRTSIIIQINLSNISFPFAGDHAFADHLLMKLGTGVLGLDSFKNDRLLELFIFSISFE